MRDLILGYFGTRNLGDQIMLQEVINLLPEEDEVFYMWGGQPLMFNPGRAKLVGQPQPPYDRVIFTVGGFWSYRDVRGRLGNATLIGMGIDSGALKDLTIYNEFDVITARSDIAYWKLFETLTCPVVHSTDVVFGMNIKKENHEREGIGVCYSAHYIGPAEAARELKRLIAKTGKKIELIPMSYEKRADLATRAGGYAGDPFDWSGCLTIQKLMKDVVVKPLPNTISEAVSRIQHYEAIISMRLHTGYLAALTGTPFVMCTGTWKRPGKFDDASVLCTGETLSLQEVATNFEVRPVNTKLVNERIKANKVNSILARATKETLNQKLGWAREAQRP